MDKRSASGTLTLARKVVTELQASYAEYLAECESDRANGHRPHYCEHGASQWTDYDNICGGCEDGLTLSDGVQLRREALRIAHERMARAHEIISSVSAARAALQRSGISSHAIGEILDIDRALEIACEFIDGKRTR